MPQQSIGIPINLLVYKPQQKTTALCWQVNLDTKPTLDLLDFEVEVDVVVDFNSINKKIYTKDNIVNYQNGTFFKAFVIDDPLLFETQKYYWRVRVNSEYYISEWSDYKEENINNFLDNMEYDIPVRVEVPNNDDRFAIQKTYETRYIIDAEIYTEEEFINKLNTDYGITIFLGSLEYDVDKKIKVNENDYITIRMIHVPMYALDNNVNNRYSQTDFIDLLKTEYDITDNIYVYVGPYEFDINKITWYNDTETAENLLPDNYVYTKIGNTNIKRILEMYMRLIGVFKNEAIQVANNYNYRKTQDKDLYDILGILLTYTRNINEPFITYKYELLNLWQAFLQQGTIEAFNIIFKTFYGVLPKIEILKDKIDETWYLYGQMQLLSIDGTTPANLNINEGDAFYNANLDKILIATHGSTIGDWSNAYEQAPDEMTTYQVMGSSNLVNYQYIGASNSFYEGIPNVERYYVTDEVEYSSYLPNPYLYTNQYLAHNLVITLDNIYNIQLDKKILMEILNNLKPLNVNILLYINDFVAPYGYGWIGYYGNPKNFWGKQEN